MSYFINFCVLLLFFFTGRRSAFATTLTSGGGAEGSGEAELKRPTSRVAEGRDDKQSCDVKKIFGVRHFAGNVSRKMKLKKK